MGVASGWNVWVWLECISVFIVCCCKELCSFPHNNYILLIPIYSILLALFFVYSSIPTPLFIFKMFFRSIINHGNILTALFPIKYYPLWSLKIHKIFISNM